MSEIAEKIIYGATCLIDIYFLYILYDGAFERRDCPKWLAAAEIVLAVLLNGLLYSHEYSVIYVVVNTIMLGMIAVTLFGGSIIKQLAYLGLYIGLIFPGEGILLIGGLLITAEPSWLEESSGFVTIATLVGVYILKFLLIKVWNQIWGRKERRMSGKMFLAICVLPITSCLLVIEQFPVYCQLAEQSQLQLSIVLGLLLIANVLTFYLFERISGLLAQQQEYALLKQKSELEERYYSKIEELSRQQAIYRHDMKHYLSALYLLVSKEGSENAEAQKVLLQMEEQLTQTGFKMYTRSGILNALLSEKEAQAEKSGLEMEMNIEPDIDVSFIKETDLVAMIGNLLDNAIEAGKKVLENNRFSENKITVNIFESEGNFTLIMIENYFDSMPKKENNRYITTKSDKKSHGIGIESVRELAGKYGGLLDIQIKNGKFSAAISVTDSAKK